MRRVRLTQRAGPRLLILSLIALGACRAGAEETESEGRADKMAAAVTADRHLLLIVARNPAGFRIDEIRVVQSALPKTRFTQDFDWRAVLEDSAGHRLFSTTIPEGGTARGAFPLPDGGIESVHQRRDTFSFALRIPLLSDAERVRFWDMQPRATGVASPSALAPAETELGSLSIPRGLQ
jgi:hypothetical protein